MVQYGEALVLGARSGSGHCESDSNQYGIYGASNVMKRGMHLHETLKGKAANELLAGILLTPSRREERAKKSMRQRRARRETQGRCNPGRDSKCRSEPIEKTCRQSMLMDGILSIQRSRTLGHWPTFGKEPNMDWRRGACMNLGSNLRALVSGLFYFDVFT
jgi:hypothetical protein